MKDKINSRRGIILTTVLLIIIAIFSFLGSVLVFAKIDSLNKGEPFFDKIILGILLPFSFVAYCIYALVDKFPLITIDKIGISFKTLLKNQTVLWSDIQKITLTGKKPSPFGIPLPIEATTILTKDSKELIIYADYFNNISELLTVLERADKLLNKDTGILSLSDFSVNPLVVNDNFLNSNEVNVEKYSGKNFLTFMGGIFYFFIAMDIYLIFTSPAKFLQATTGILFIIIPTTLFFIAFSKELHYFIVSDNYLVIKNHLWFWSRKTFLIDNIKEVVIEEKGIRVLTIDFKSYLFEASNIKKDTWKLLVERFKKNHITIRQELNLD